MSQRIQFFIGFQVEECFLEAKNGKRGNDFGSSKFNQTVISLNELTHFKLNLFVIKRYN